MTEPTFREIQLSKKQLVFLFMAMVVLAAVVFLLGVSLGRRLPATMQATAPADAATGIASTADMPPATVLTPDDRKYATELQGRGAVPPATPVPAPGAANPAASAPAATSAATLPASTAAPQAAAVTPPTSQSKPPVTPPPTPASSASKPAPPAAAPAPSPVAVAGGWFLQVNAFRSRENAEVEVRQLKGKGHAAFVSPGGSLFRVRVGPFATRAEADTASAALRQAGFKPSITR